LGTFWFKDVLTWDVLTRGRFGLGTFWLGDVLNGKQNLNLPFIVLLQNLKKIFQAYNVQGFN